MSTRSQETGYGCGGPKAREELMSGERNKATLRRFDEEVWNGRDLSIVDELFAPEHIFRAAGGRVLDRQGHKQMIANFQSAFPDGQNTVIDVVAEGDRVASRWMYRGTHRGEFEGIPPTGKQITLTGISIWRFERDKIVESWHEFDALGMLQQIGAVPSPEDAA